MSTFVVEFHEKECDDREVAGGKGANLGELSRIGGVRVPQGACVAARAYTECVSRSVEVEPLLSRLSVLREEDQEQIAATCGEIRRIIEGLAIPPEVSSELGKFLSRMGENTPCAVRSSATAEDLPSASFAGQYDTYLNVSGTAAILESILRCWGSLFTERAALYRIRHGIDHRAVAMAVVVQKMIFPEASGVLVTADPLTSRRNVISIEASLGLGEAVVSGMVTPDVYTVRGGTITSTAISDKKVCLRASSRGGTETQEVPADLRTAQVLTDPQILELAELGTRIEDHFGWPQDIEWCRDDEGFHIVQSRRITTLFPIPEKGDGGRHVFISVGHQQMMTDAMKPLGLSLWQLTTSRPMYVAGGRLFVDVISELSSPDRREALLDVMGRGDPLIRDALETLLARGDVIPSLPADVPRRTGKAGRQAPLTADPDIVTGLIRSTQESLAALKRDIRTKKGPELVDFIVEDLTELKRILFDPASTRVFMSAMESTRWLNEHLEEWLGEKNAADVLTQSVPHNITSEMGLALLDVADAFRPFPELAEFLRHAEDGDVADGLARLPGGRDAQAALREFLDTYGMRCAGEIDITRPRWSERPSALFPLILGNLANFSQGASTVRFEQGRALAAEKEKDLLVRLRALPDGERKARETKERIDVVRTFIGYREYPKYGMVCRYFMYKQALLEEAGRLVSAHVLRDKEDVFYLTVEEFRAVSRTRHAEEAVIEERKRAFRTYEELTPPRVMTSEGETLHGEYRRDRLPRGALIGIPVSAGTVDGRARVIFDLEGASLDAGDILVTVYTDPSWTPVFVSLGGLVTEVGGVMTHGAVIAREYGLPAVVGVQGATALIRDGQRIRVHGTEGFVELLDPAPDSR